MSDQTINLDDLQREAEQLLDLLHDRHPGLFTWNEALAGRLHNIYSLLDNALATLEPAGTNMTEAKSDNAG